MSSAKVCTACGGAAQSLAQFYRNRARPDGYDHLCKGCRQARSQRTWRTYRRPARRAAPVTAPVSGHRTAVEASRVLLAGRLGEVPAGCDRCPLPRAGVVCDPNAPADLPCELSDAEAGVDVRRLSSAGEPWLSETHAPLRPSVTMTDEFGALDRDTYLDPSRRAARAARRAMAPKEAA